MGQLTSDSFKTSSDEAAKEQLEMIQEMAESNMDAHSERMAANAQTDKNPLIVAIVDTKKCC